MEKRALENKRNLGLMERDISDGSSMMWPTLDIKTRVKSRDDTGEDYHTPRVMLYQGDGDLLDGDLQSPKNIAKAGEKYYADNTTSPNYLPTAEKGCSDENLLGSGRRLRRSASGGGSERDIVDKLFWDTKKLLAEGEFGGSTEDFTQRDPMRGTNSSRMLQAKADNQNNQNNEDYQNQVSYRPRDFDLCEFMDRENNLSYAIGRSSEKLKFVEDMQRTNQEKLKALEDLQIPGMTDISHYKKGPPTPAPQKTLISNPKPKPSKSHSPDNEDLTKDDQNSLEGHINALEKKLSKIVHQTNNDKSFPSTTNQKYSDELANQNKQSLGSGANQFFNTEGSDYLNPFSDRNLLDPRFYPSPANGSGFERLNTDPYQSSDIRT
jgi:hypothetical protein